MCGQHYPQGTNQKPDHRRGQFTGASDALAAEGDAICALYELVGDASKPLAKAPPDSSWFFSLIKNIKEYWFLVALVTSGVTVALYMIVFNVTPWDVHVETRNKRQQTQHHVQVGFDLLERAKYQLAKTEFERALSLTPTSESAISGRYLSELFIDMNSADWDPAVGLSLEKRLEERFRDNRDYQERRHIIEAYLGDLHAGVSDFSVAKKHYEEAIRMKANYWGALKSYYSLVYSDSANLGLDDEERGRKLIELGESLVAIDSYDYRGMHALGYALYEAAIAESDESLRDELLGRAVAQSFKAYQLKGNEFEVVADLGEIIRHKEPEVSLDYHRWAREILDQPKEDQPNTMGLSVFIRLHRSSGTLAVAKQDKKTVLMYYIALDYLAMYRIGGKKRDLNLHRESLLAAKKLDPDLVIADVYEDQLKVLDMLLPAKS